MHPKADNTMVAPLELRPYQLLCLFCAPGRTLEEPGAERVAAALRLIREQPDRPVMLRAQAHDVYCYQDPGEGHSEFERKRDLDVLAALDLPPGAVLPARTLLYRVLKAIPTVAGLCGYEGCRAPAWSGCPRAFAGYYEAGREAGVEALVSPREAGEMARDKAASVAAMGSGVPLRIRPHVAMCAVCNYGTHDGHPEPLGADNIVEFIDLIKRDPGVLVALAQGADWMVCAPCPKRVADLNACVNVCGSGGLSNEKRDLDLLQLLGLTYETTLPARELLALLFSRVPHTGPVCRRDQPELSVWWDGCGESNRTAGNSGYERGRELLAEELQLAL